MSFKNNLKRGQASLEYFIIFSVIALLTIVSLSSFFTNVKAQIQGKNGFVNQAADRITQ